MVRENSDSEWDKYWDETESSSSAVRVYSRIASFYRNTLIGPRLNYELSKHFSRGAVLLHAGSGAGEVDIFVREKFSITALDMSANALSKYKQRYPSSESILGDITNLQVVDRKFDGVYNLGVMEHLTPEQIKKALKEFSAILSDNGKVVLFWPPVYGSSVIFLHCVHYLLRKIFRKDLTLHPDEPNKLSFRKYFKHYIKDTDFILQNFRVSYRDFFTYLVVVLEKKSTRGNC
jgi:ubiquinone/menaquinone biosynthesis C-methylase UbiE